MKVWLIPLNNALPAVQAYLYEREPDKGLDETEASRHLFAAVATSEVLVEFALALAGRPSQS